MTPEIPPGNLPPRQQRDPVQKGRQSDSAPGRYTDDTSIRNTQSDGLDTSIPKPRRLGRNTMAITGRCRSPSSRMRNRGLILASAPAESTPAEGPVARARRNRRTRAAGRGARGFGRAQSDIADPRGRIWIDEAKPSCHERAGATTSDFGAVEPWRRARSSLFTREFTQRIAT